jgi:hypothetical protein
MCVCLCVCFCLCLRLRADASRKSHSLCKAQVRISKTESEPWWASLSAFVVIWCYLSSPCLKYSVKSSRMITFSFFPPQNTIILLCISRCVSWILLWLGRIGETNYVHPGNAQFPLYARARKVLGKIWDMSESQFLSHAVCHTHVPLMLHRILIIMLPIPFKRLQTHHSFPHTSRCPTPTQYWTCVQFSAR